MICEFLIAGRRFFYFITLRHELRFGRVHFGTTDIFAYFEEHERLQTLPTFEELEVAAKQLFETYVAPRARHEVRIDARDEATADIPRAPLGSPWQSPAPPTTALKKGKEKAVKALKVGASTTTKKKTQKKKVAEVPKPPFVGDQVAFDDGTFMYDAMISREVAAAVAQGDIGRVWEGLKVNLGQRRECSDLN
jgi:hypothetical protein